MSLFLLFFSTLTHPFVFLSCTHRSCLRFSAIPEIDNFLLLMKKKDVEKEWRESDMSGKDIQALKDPNTWQNEAEKIGECAEPQGKRFFFYFELVIEVFAHVICSFFFQQKTFSPKGKSFLICGGSRSRLHQRTSFSRWSTTSRRDSLTPPQDPSFRTFSMS